MRWVELVSPLLAIVSLVLTIYYGARANRFQAKVGANAERRVTRLVKARLLSGGSLTADQVRGIAETVAHDYGIRAPTDKQLVILLRLLALELEDGNELTPEIYDDMDRIRKALEPSGRPLLSIAATDRPLATYLMVVTTLGSIVMVHIGLAFASESTLLLLSLNVLEVSIVSVSWCAWRSLQRRVQLVSTSLKA